MTKNANQTLSSPTASLSLSLSLTPDEWHFVFYLLCELRITLVRGIGVLGLCDLADRRDTVSALLQRVADRDEQGTVVLSEFEIYELHAALSGFAYYPHDIDTLERERSLLASVRDKLAAAESSVFAVEPAAVEPSPTRSVQQALPFSAAPAESVPAEPEPEPAPAEAAPAESKKPTLTADECSIILNQLGGNIRFEQGVFHSEVLGAIVHILQGKKDAPALQASSGDVLDAAWSLRRDYEWKCENYDALCDDYDHALQLIDKLKDRLKEVLSSSGVKRALTNRRRATGRTGRWYEALEVSHA